MGETSTSSPRLLPYVILLGAVFALGSLGVDAILPALSQIATDLQLSNPNISQWLVIAFVLGMGIGNLVGGPLSDSVGRRKIITAGLLMYMGSSFVMSTHSAWPAFDYQLEAMLLMRVLQGAGASFATVAATAMVRDVFTGPAMARVLSHSMVIFAMMPALAPFLGKFVAGAWGWPIIFLVFALFALVITTYTKATMKETNTHLAPLSFSALKQSAADVLGIQIVRRAILAQTLVFGVLFSLISTIQPIFDQTFHRATSFPEYFALMALAIAFAGIANGKAVQKSEPLTLARMALTGQVVAGGFALTGIEMAGTGTDLAFGIFMAWGCISFFCNGFIIGNLSSVAMDPAGEHAGMASTLISSIPLIGAVVLDAPVSVFFNGTPQFLLNFVVTFAGFAVAAITLFKKTDAADQEAAA
ncbi:MFS transporter [Pseudomonas putida]|uniref:MFS transporter n=1 Tax=Pseudomonas putida TaxID=303 RepID=A0A8I1ECH2_PSEPU|nr:MFS transporter [Pseudomonas putida]MBI6882748.1 MFS transporter [Pseudomonas putida]